MSLVFDVLSIIAIGTGAFFFFAGTVGLLRFPDALTRLHALTKADNLGLGLVVLGLLPRTGSLLASPLCAAPMAAGPDDIRGLIPFTSTSLML
jgi:multicomponent Na+:H+ antiporter subunit G